VEETTSIASITGLEAMSVYPTVLQSGTLLNISLEATTAIDGQISLVDLSGKRLYSEQVNYATGIHEVTIATKGLAAGLYLVGLKTPRGQVFKKIIIQK